jgi:2-dehydro-3-deoxygalactonokinase
MAPSEGGVTEAFLYGVTIARSQETSLLATLFSVRTLGLTGQLKAEQQSDYLSGLLIGNELVSLEKCLARQDGLNLLDRTIVLCGEAGLCERYRAALASLGCHTVDWVSDATERGLWHIAVHAGLVSMPTRFELPLSPTAQPSIGTMKEEAQ